jgi:hypothetical protein
MEKGFGLVEIKWESGPNIILRAVDVEGQTAFEYKVE